MNIKEKNIIEKVIENLEIAKRELYNNPIIAAPNVDLAVIRLKGLISEDRDKDTSDHSLCEYSRNPVENDFMLEYEKAKDNFYETQVNDFMREYEKAKDNFYQTQV